MGGIFGFVCLSTAHCHSARIAPSPPHWRRLHIASNKVAFACCSFFRTFAVSRDSRKRRAKREEGVGMDAKTSKPRGGDRPSTLAAPLWCSKRRRRRGCVVGFCKVVSSMLRLASSLSCCCFLSLSLFLLCPLVSLSMHQQEEEAATKRKTLHLCCSLPQSGRKTHYLFHFCFSWTPPYQGHNFLFLRLFVLAASPVLVGNCQIQPSTLFFSRGFEWEKGKKGRELHIFLSRLLEFSSATTTTPARGGRTKKGLKEEEEGKKESTLTPPPSFHSELERRGGALNSTEPQQRRRRRRSSSLSPPPSGF